jgi:predicted LPLAT superfamily acyltransferase
MQSNKNEWSGKSRGGSFGYKFFIFMIRQFGVRAAYAFLSLVVIYFIPFAFKSTKAIWKYNRRILKYNRIKSVLKLYQHYYLFGQTLIDKLAITNGLASQFKFEFENYDQFLAQLNQGASIMIGAHVGCWEIGSEFFGDYASKLNVVMHDNEYQKIKELVQSSKSGYKIIAINEGSIESLLKIKQAIDKGEYVCFQGDRYIDKSTTHPVLFMGMEALFPIGPSLLASKFDVPVIFYFAMRERGMRYRFIFHTVAPGLSPKEILNLYVSELEKVMKRYPQQWFNFYDVWQQK